jgi:hypothetical protein
MSNGEQQKEPVKNKIKKFAEKVSVGIGKVIVENRTGE